MYRLIYSYSLSALPGDYQTCSKLYVAILAIIICKVETTLLKLKYRVELLFSTFCFSSSEKVNTVTLEKMLIKNIKKKIKKKNIKKQKKKHEKKIDSFMAIVITFEHVWYPS